MGLRTLIHAVITTGNGVGLRVPFLRSQAARTALSLLLLVSLPLFSDTFAVRAGFVVEVVPVDDKVGETEITKEDLSRGTAVVWSNASQSHRSSDASELAKRYEAWLAMLRNGQPNTGDAPSRPGPMPRGPQPHSENQGCQGTGGGATAASAVQVAGLPAAPIIVGPDLAMRLIAREAHLHIEQFSGRLFRPPRQV